MKLTLAQKEKFEEIEKAINVLFYHSQFEFIYKDIKEAWLIGDTVRDLLLFKNPNLNSYDFYLLVEEPELIEEWLVSLKQNNIIYKEYDGSPTLNENIYKIIKLSLTQFDIIVEINLLFGFLTPPEFIEENIPITISQIGLDLSDLFISYMKRVSTENLLNKIWYGNKYKEDIKNKSITVLKQDWMKDKESYYALEAYLAQQYFKLNTLGFK